MGYNSDCRAKKNEVKCDGNNKNLNPDFLSRYVEAGRVSINRNVIAKCLEFYEISLLNYFVKDSHTFEPIQLNTNYVPRPADQSSPSASQVDTLSWCSHQIEMEGLGPRTRQNDNYARSPLYDHVNKLANLYRKQPRELPPIDFNQITPPQELDELLCTISICCKYYIADCLKRAQEDALAHGSTVVTARRIYEAARREPVILHDLNAQLLH